MRSTTTVSKSVCRIKLRAMIPSGALATLGCSSTSRGPRNRRSPGRLRRQGCECRKACGPEICGAIGCWPMQRLGKQSSRGKTRGRGPVRTIPTGAIMGKIVDTRGWIVPRFCLRSFSSTYGFPDCPHRRLLRAGLRSCVPRALQPGMSFSLQKQSLKSKLPHWVSSLPLESLRKSCCSFLRAKCALDQMVPASVRLALGGQTEASLTIADAVGGKL